MMSSQKVLIICGPTASGKTRLASDLASLINGELISADSRQVYKYLDIVTGKDVPSGVVANPTQVFWRNRPLVTYELDGSPVWLYGVVEPNEDFSVSAWLECADLAVSDILSRDKTPIVVGGTGLYIKSFIERPDKLGIPANGPLRESLSRKSPDYLFDYLRKLDPTRSARLNSSDRKNPRRLLRAIEIASFQKDVLSSVPKVSVRNFDMLKIGLNADRKFLFERIDARIENRIQQGAREEAVKLLQKYAGFQSMTACGYDSFTKPDPILDWKHREHRYLRRQQTWFKKSVGVNWYSIEEAGFEKKIAEAVLGWYNNSQSEYQIRN